MLGRVIDRGVSRGIRCGLGGALGCAIGCGPGSFTPAEAGVVYEAVSSVNADTYAAIYAFSAPDGEDTAGLSEATAKGLSWYEEAAGGRFDGTVDGPGSWTGTVQVDGDYTITLTSADTWSVVWSLDATYVGVTYGELVLDGDIRWNIRATADRGTFTHTSTVTGDIVAHGAADGAGALDYGTTVSLSGGRYQVVTLGTVGGHDISTSYDATAFGL